nr:unnamed protein product [Callosobruchus analis]
MKTSPSVIYIEYKNGYRGTVKIFLFENRRRRIYNCWIKAKFPTGYKKKIEAKAQTAKKTSNLNNNNVKKTNQKQAVQQNGTSKKSKSKSKSENSKQWEEWKKKDDEFDLQCAILQSKLDFETQKKNSVSVIMTTQDKHKKKKTKTMSLDQFLDNSPNKDKETSKPEVDSDFFEKAICSAKEEVKRERVEEKRRQRANNIEEVITLAQCQELRKELEEAKKEITMVKKRNKTLCSMLSQGEMKDKVAVLLELEKLTTVKEELTEEVARLHKLLEQERSSKNNASSESHTSIKHKEKTNKKKQK